MVQPGDEGGLRGRAGVPAGAGAARQPGVDQGAEHGHPEDLADLAGGVDDGRGIPARAASTADMAIELAGVPARPAPAPSSAKFHQIALSGVAAPSRSRPSVAVPLTSSPASSGQPPGPVEQPRCG